MSELHQDYIHQNAHRNTAHTTHNSTFDYKILHVVTRNSLKCCLNLSISVQSLMTCCTLNQTETLLGYRVFKPFFISA